MTSVKFTPGPHPSSGTSTRASASPYPTRSTAPGPPVLFPSASTSTSTSTPSALNDDTQPASSSSTHAIAAVPESSQEYSYPSSMEDAERQPLLLGRDRDGIRRRGVAYTMSVVVLVLVAVGVIVGFGGWRLGKGAGGGRWPGGPGWMD